MDFTEVVYGSLNIAILAIFYTVFGAIISFFIYHLFDDFDKEWENSGLMYQCFDIGVELSIVGSIAYWTTAFIRDHPPLIPISRELDRQIDTYISGLFFAFAMFLFLGDLSTKIQYLYKTYLQTHFVKVFPEKWSITRWMRKTELKKDSSKDHQNGVSAYSNN
jgi:hypothetical protein